MGRLPAEREQGTGGGPEPGSGVPGFPGRDPELAGFAKGGSWNACLPSAALCVALESASGVDWRCAGATDDELTGLLRQWAAIESWAAAGRLGVIRAMMRSQDAPWLTARHHGDLPDTWDESLIHELALALVVSHGSADTTAVLAWELEARLPGIGALLADGTLTLSKARMVAEQFRVLSEDDATKAEELLLDSLSGATPKTYAQLMKLAERAACTVDPGQAERRRKDAEKEDARVQLWREQSGAAGLAGRNLPTDEALAAMASVNARAQLYRKSKAFADAAMDQLRAMAYLDLLNEVPADARIAHAQAMAAQDGERRDDGPGNEGGQRPGDSGPGDAGGGPGSVGGPGDVGGPSEDGNPGNADSPASGDTNSTPDSQGTLDSDGTPDSEGIPDSEGTPDNDCTEPPVPSQRPLPALTIPLMTLLGLAERPGEGYGLGVLDPDLCRRLAAIAVGYPASQLCVTVTDRNGFAVGHGCAKPTRAGRSQQPQKAEQQQAPRLAALPARVNLTVPATALSVLARAPDGWAFTQVEGPGPPAGYGTWILETPSGQFTVHIEPVPTFDCDHRHESHAYQPNDKLRHLVQVRDGECTFPSCSRHARESDFEHALPYHKGGRTCSCNGGARSRRCHRVKQSPGWSVSQPLPGWHQWTTPSGRSYMQGPMKYPALRHPSWHHIRSSRRSGALLLPAQGNAEARHEERGDRSGPHHRGVAAEAGHVFIAHLEREAPAHLARLDAESVLTGVQLILKRVVGLERGDLFAVDRYQERATAQFNAEALSYQSERR